MLKIGFFSILCCWVSFSLAQKNNPDSLFNDAQLKAQSGNYDAAILTLKELNKIYPENGDYATYLARVYFWDNQTVKAREILDSEWEKGNNSEETLRLFIQVLLTDNKGARAATLSDEGISRFPKEREYYQLQKAIALEQQDKDRDALVVIDQIPEGSDQYESAQYLKTQILQKQKNEVGVGYLNTTFSNPGAPPWHIWYAQYKRKLPRNDIIGRVNYGYLFGENAVQGEVDLYPKVGDNSYFYLNAGISDGQSVFPLVRLGAEFYHERNRWSGSVGARYLHFDQAQVLMLTGHLGRNFGGYFIAYRPFMVAISNDWFPSHILNVRKSFETKESFIQLDLQYGGVPYYFFVSNEFSRVSAYRAGINWKFRVRDNFFVQPIVMYEWEEFVPENYRHRYNVQLNLFLRF